MPHRFTGPDGPSAVTAPPGPGGASPPRTAATPGVALPGVLVRFLERASIAIAGGRDPSLVPQLYWVCGWAREPEPDRIAFFVTEPFAARLLHDVAACPRLALTIEHVGPHETYQFKGDYVANRAVSDADRAAFEGCRARYVEAVLEIELRFRFTAQDLSRYLGEPARTIVMSVDEVFLQTPGPGAGRRLLPPEQP